MASRKRAGSADLSLEMSKKVKHSGSSEVDGVFTDERSAGQKVFDILLLAETIGLYLDLSTLITAYGGVEEIAAVIDNNTQLQKKMFLLPAASFAEAEALNMLEDDSVILYNEDYFQGQALTPIAALNTFALDITAGVQEKAHLLVSDDGPCCVRLSRAVLPDIASSRRGRGLWERMYLTQPPTFTSDLFAATNDKLVTTTPHGHPAAIEGMCEFDCIDLPEDLNLRRYIDTMEEWALEDDDATIKWSSAEISFGDGRPAVRYRLYCGLIRAGKLYYSSDDGSDDESSTYGCGPADEDKEAGEVENEQ